MSHEIHHVVSFEHVAPFTLRAALMKVSPKLSIFVPSSKASCTAHCAILRYSTKFGLTPKLTHLFGLTARTLTRRRFTIGRRLEPLCAV